MNETGILIRLLQMYIPQNWEFGSALSKLRKSGGGVKPPIGTPLVLVSHLNFLTSWLIFTKFGIIILPCKTVRGDLWEGHLHGVYTNHHPGGRGGGNVSSTVAKIKRKKKKRKKFELVDLLEASQSETRGLRRIF
jgi:hypothetical protein